MPTIELTKEQVSSLISMFESASWWTPAINSESNKEIRRILDDALKE